MKKPLKTKEPITTPRADTSHLTGIDKVIAIYKEEGEARRAGKVLKYDPPAPKQYDPMEVARLAAMVLRPADNVADAVDVALQLIQRAETVIKLREAVELSRDARRREREETPEWLDYMKGGMLITGMNRWVGPRNGEEKFLNLIEKLVQVEDYIRNPPDDRGPLPKVDRKKVTSIIKSHEKEGFKRSELLHLREMFERYKKEV